MDYNTTPELVARRIATAPAVYRGTIDKGEARFAVCRGLFDRPETVVAYLPDNYALMESFTDERGKLVAIIGGTDVAGWTLEAYVIPRLLSGLISCEEIA